VDKAKLIPLEGEANVLIRESSSGTMQVSECYPGAVMESESKDGTGLVRIIVPGQGSKGYYPEAVLKRDCPQIMKKGTFMMWDHATEDQRKNHPEDSLNRQAGAFTGDAYWDESGPLGKGVYAPYRALSEYKGRIAERLELGLIGVSWSGWVKFTEGQVAGKPTRIVQQMTAAESVDFVTRAGAGGSVARASEAATPAETKRGVMEVSDQEYADLKAKAGTVSALEAQVATLLADNLKSRARAVVEAKLKPLAMTDKAKERTVVMFLATVPVKEGKLDETVLNAELDAYVADFGVTESTTSQNTGKVELPGETAKAQEGAPTVEQVAANLMKLGYSKEKAEMFAKEAAR
jgi:hypothetical protein